MASDDRLKEADELYVKGAYDKALPLYEDATNRNPRDLHAWIQRGSCFGKLGRYDEAITCFDAALEIHPRSANAFIGKGVSFERSYRFDEAVQCYDALLALDPGNATAWSYRAVSLEFAGRLEEALESATRALAIDPGDSVAVRTRQMIAAKLGRTRPANAREEVVQLVASLATKSTGQLMAVRANLEDLSADPNVRRVVSMLIDAFIAAGENQHKRLRLLKELMSS